MTNTGPLEGISRSELLSGAKLPSSNQENDDERARCSDSNQSNIRFSGSAACTLASPAVVETVARSSASSHRTNAGSGSWQEVVPTGVPVTRQHSMEQVPPVEEGGRNSGTGREDASGGAAPEEIRQRSLTSTVHRQQSLEQGQPEVATLPSSSMQSNSQQQQQPECEIDSTQADSAQLRGCSPDQRENVGSHTRDDNSPAVEEELECRICLMSDARSNLYAPCKCIGSVQYAHLSCLLRWCKERKSTKCEICGSTYHSDLLPMLEAEVKAQQAQQQRLDQMAQLSLQLSEAEAAGDQAYNPDQHSSAARNRSRASRWLLIKVSLVLVVTGVLLFAIFALGSKGGQPVWVAVMLRIMIFIIPVYLVYRGIAACLTYRSHAAMVRGYQEREEQRGQHPVVIV